tara:strand:- start:510 stop:689 length:180 start_codon:yes stop_codon:yes gene_type:complete
MARIPKFLVPMAQIQRIFVKIANGIPNLCQWHVPVTLALIAIGKKFGSFFCQWHKIFCH